MSRLARPSNSDSRSGPWPASYQDYLSFRAVREFSIPATKKRSLQTAIDFTNTEEIKNAILAMCGSPALVNLFLCRLAMGVGKPHVLYSRFTRWLNGYGLRLYEKEWAKYRAKWNARRIFETKEKVRMADKKRGPRRV